MTFMILSTLTALVLSFMVMLCVQSIRIEKKIATSVEETELRVSRLYSKSGVK
jgi:hypothetical protein